ncbi:MAG: hypothetical protein ACK4UN_10790 [Limisphaerales bacterium]
MKDPLDKLLAEAKAPQWPEEHWSNFPKEVRRAIRAKQFAATGEPGGSGFRWKLVFAMAGLVAAFFSGFYFRAPEKADLQMAQTEKVIREMSTLFPGRIRSITINSSGIQLSLAESENISNAQPLLVKVCPSKGDCNKIITFSGQTIQLDGKAFEVLLSSSGEVLLVGQEEIWSSSEKKMLAGVTRIEALALRMNL